MINIHSLTVRQSIGVWESRVGHPISFVHLPSHSWCGLFWSLDKWFGILMVQHSRYEPNQGLAGRQHCSELCKARVGQQSIIQSRSNSHNHFPNMKKRKHFTNWSSEGGGAVRVPFALSTHSGKSSQGEGASEWHQTHCHMYTQWQPK